MSDATPTCKGCGATLVERKNPTYEQAFCGTWFDHPPVERWSCLKINDSHLIASPQLLAQHEQMRVEHEAALL